MTKDNATKVVYYKKYRFVVPGQNHSDALKALLENEGYTRRTY